MPSFDAGDIAARLTLDRDPFQRELRAAREEVRRFEQESATVTLKIDRDQLDRDLRDVKARLDRLARESASPTITPDVDDKPLDDLRADLKRMDKEKATPTVEVDVDRGDMDKTKVDLQRFDQMKVTAKVNVLINKADEIAMRAITDHLRRMERIRARPRIDVDGGTAALGQIGAVSASMDKLSRKTATPKIDIDSNRIKRTLSKIDLDLDRHNTRLVGVVAGWTTLGTAIVGVGIAAGGLSVAALPAIAAVGLGAAGAAAGLGAYAVGVAHALADTPELSAQATELSKAFGRMSSDAVGKSIPALFDAAEATFPLIGQMMSTTADSVIDLSKDLTRFLQSPGGKQFGDTWAGISKLTLGPFVRSLGNIALGITGIARAFTPDIARMADIIEDASGSFAKWGNTLSRNQGFKDFRSWVRDMADPIDRLKDGFGDLISSLTVGLAGAVPASLDFTGDLAEQIAGIVDAIAPHLPGALDALSDALDVLGPLIADFAAGFGPGVIAGIKGFAEVMEDLNKVFSAIDPDWARHLGAIFGVIVVGLLISKALAIGKLAKALATLYGILRTKPPAVIIPPVTIPPPVGVTGGAGGVMAKMLGVAKVATLYVAAAEIGGQIGARISKSILEGGKNVTRVDIDTFLGFPIGATTFVAGTPTYAGPNLDLVKQSEQINDFRDQMDDFAADAGGWNTKIGRAWTALSNDTRDLAVNMFDMTGPERRKALEEIMKRMWELNDVDLEKVSGKIKTTGQNMDGVGKAAGRARLSVEDFAKEVSDLLTPFQDLTTATGQWREALGSLVNKANGANVSIDKVTGGLRGNNKAGKDFVDTLNATVGGLDGVLQKMADTQQPAAKMRTAVEQTRQKIRDAGEAAGLTEDQIRDLIKAYGLTPKQVETKIRQLGAQDAKKKTDEFRDSVNKVPDKKTTRFEANTDAASNKAEQLKTDITNKMQELADKEFTTSIGVSLSGNVGKINVPSAFAEGGEVRGPGSWVADRVPALLANDEHVWTGKEVRAVGGHRAMYRLRDAALKRQLPRLADGGTLGPLINFDMETNSTGLSGAIQEFGQKLVDAVAQAMKDKQEAVQAQRVEDAGAGVQRWAGLVSKALDIMGQSQTLIGTVLRRMNQESGGNPNAINNWDSNAARGDPSRGLMQTIGSTFRAYHSPGTSWNIYDPLANILASMRYALSRYGSLSAAYNRAGGYARGGAPQAGEMAWVGENGPELVRFGTTSRVFTNSESRRLAEQGAAIDYDKLAAAVSPLVNVYASLDGTPIRAVTRQEIERHSRSRARALGRGKVGV